MDPLVILIIATVIGCFILFVVIKKVLKFLVAALALIITAVIVGYLFLTGDGQLTKDYLPEAEQEKLEQFRSQSKETIKEKAGKVKETAVQKAEEQIDKAVQKSKEKIADEISGKSEKTETTPETKSNDASKQNETTNETTK